MLRLDFPAEAFWIDCPHGVRLLARPLDPEELGVVRRLLADLLDWYRTRPDDARSLITTGESKPRFADATVLAGWTLVANELFNLDEALCK